MAEIQTSTWSETAASNNTAAPDGMPEGMAASGVNDWGRESMAALKREWNRTHPTISSAGTSTAITLTYTTAPAAYVAGLKFQFKVGTTNGATPTLNVNALGAKNIYKIVAGTATQIASGDWTANQIVEVTYDTTLNGAAGGFIWSAANPGDTGLLATQAQVNTGTSTVTTVSPGTLIGRPGIPIQIVNTQTGAVATGTTTLPFDDTIPQNTEGDQYMTLAVTPKRTTSILEIRVVAFATNSAGGGRLGVALFQDATANALAAGFGGTNVIGPLPLVLTHRMTSGTTSATTFKVRIGNSSAGTTTFNGDASARIYGGVLASSITITEIAE